MKITTKDCVDYLGEQGFLGKWKRSAKYYSKFTFIEEKSMDELTIMREFTCVDYPNKIAFVIATKDRIISAKVLEPKGNVSELFETDEYRRIKDNPITECRLCSDWIVPMIKVDEEDGDYEKQDFENYEIESMTDTTVTLSHGGDWQEPLTVEYRYMSDGCLYYNPRYKMTEV
jgi:hypothetical protein